MGADIYETEEEASKLLLAGKVPVGIGGNTKIRWVLDVEQHWICITTGSSQISHSLTPDGILWWFSGTVSLTWMLGLGRTWWSQTVRWAQRTYMGAETCLLIYYPFQRWCCDHGLFHSLWQGFQEADHPEEGYYIRSGIVVILKNATIKDGSVIQTGCVCAYKTRTYNGITSMDRVTLVWEEPLARKSSVRAQDA